MSLDARVDAGSIQSHGHHRQLRVVPQRHDRNWHDNQDQFTKIVLKTEMAMPKTEKKEQQHELA